MVISDLWQSVKPLKKWETNCQVWSTSTRQSPVKWNRNIRFNVYIENPSFSIFTCPLSFVVNSGYSVFVNCLSFQVWIILHIVMGKSLIPLYNSWVLIIVEGRTITYIEYLPLHLPQVDSDYIFFSITENLCQVKDLVSFRKEMFKESCIC